MLIPADMAGSRMATTATSGAVKRKIGPKPKTPMQMASLRVVVEFAELVEVKFLLF